MNATRLAYLSGSYHLRHKARVLRVFQNAKGSHSVILDETIFYPQGGGQPSDVGRMASEGRSSFQVKFVRKEEETGLVHHEGAFDNAESVFEENDEVELVVDEALRKLHMRCHSGGHLVDHAIQMLGYPLEGTKGYHFPAGPYVELIVDPKANKHFDSSPSGVERFRKEIEAKSNELVDNALPVQISMTRPENLSPEVFASLPDKAKRSPCVRLIDFVGTPLALPCGGTHVENTREIGKISLKKAGMKDGVLRISYRLLDA